MTTLRSDATKSTQSLEVPVEELIRRGRRGWGRKVRTEPDVSGAVPHRSDVAGDSP